MLDVGILYVSWNRLEFTEFSFEQLLANTDWSLVDHLCVWDDLSTDGTLDYLRSRVDAVPVPVDVRVGGYKSVVTIMAKYVDAYETPLFAKVDNDIVMPPGWLNDLAYVMEDEPHLDILGTQSGFTGARGPDPVIPGHGYPHSFEPACHIGGIGLMRREAFRSRPRMNADGRHGFTLWQEKHDVPVGWITPDLHITCLDQVPFDPWASLSATYTRLGWQRPRPWPPYPRDHYTWNWWPEQMRERAA